MRARLEPLPYSGLQFVKRQGGQAIPQVPSRFPSLNHFSASPQYLCSFIAPEQLSDCSIIRRGVRSWFTVAGKLDAVVGSRRLEQAPPLWYKGLNAMQMSTTYDNRCIVENATIKRNLMLESHKCVPLALNFISVQVAVDHGHVHTCRTKTQSHLFSHPVSNEAGAKLCEQSVSDVHVSHETTVAAVVETWEEA